MSAGPAGGRRVYRWRLLVRVLGFLFGCYRERPGCRAWVVFRRCVMELYMSLLDVLWWETWRVGE
jgi:hypothetical protein